MKRLLLISACQLFSLSAFCADCYVRPTSQGSNSGADWSNAWTTSTINWNSVNPGDTIWMAGGSYSGNIQFTKSGSAGSPINVRRVRSTDSAPSSAAGWSASFDSQVVIASGGAAPFRFTTAGVGYINIDGRIANGILAQYNNAATSFLGAVHFNANNIHDVTVSNCDLAGPGGATAFSYQGDNAVVQFFNSTGVNNITISRCTIRGGPNLVYTVGNNHHVTFEYCTFKDNVSSNGNIHANVLYNIGGTDWTIRYCDFSGWQVEGIILWDSHGPWYVYGNIFHDVAAGVASCFWPGSNTPNAPQGPLFLYNNTFVGVPITTGQSRSWQFSSGSQARNNIYWNSTFASNSVISDSNYNFSNGGTPGSNSISSGANPFVDFAGKNYRITSAVASNMPRNKGVPLAAQYSTDKEGNVRGSDGAWDIGAYEVGGSPAPSPTPTPVPTVTPTPTPTPKPTPTPTPFGLSFLLNQTELTAPFTVDSNGNVSQTVSSEGSPTAGGRAYARFTVPATGDYLVQGLVNAPGTGSDSFHVNIDAEPQDPTMIWHIPLTNGLESRVASWQGSGSWSSPELVPKVFHLTAGVHAFYLRGREPGTVARSITLVPASSPTPTPQPTQTPSPTAAPTATASPTIAPTPTASPTLSPTPSPTPTATVSATIDTPSEGQIVTTDGTVFFSGHGTGGNGPPLTYLWHVVEAGSGVADSAAQNRGSTVFPNVGTWTMQFEVINADDISDSKTRSVIVVEPIGVKLPH